MSGGRERTRPAEVWDHLPQTSRERALTPWLLSLAALLLLLDVWERRTGLRLVDVPAWLKHRGRDTYQSSAAGAAAASAHAKTGRSEQRRQAADEPTEPSIENTTAQPESQGLQGALARAKQKAAQKTKR